ncbi:hypothetical protein WMY93_023151 [Mugilogobius chulae]|uniref:Uncharacterized protein n=1 Tax=Mugilogobius chulae TaxID=88201 RepID=A0AAW0NDZ6_9GOBI
MFSLGDLPAASTSRLISPPASLSSLLLAPPSAPPPANQAQSVHLKASPAAVPCYLFDTPHLRPISSSQPGSRSSSALGPPPGRGPGGKTSPNPSIPKRRSARRSSPGSERQNLLYQ